MRVLDLFSGIGGFSLAAHWAGFETAAFCEQDKFCQKVLAKNFPGTPIFDDIKTLTSDMVDIAASLSDNDSNNIDKDSIIAMAKQRKEIYDYAAKMYESGLSVQEVADYYGITRQSMWKNLKRRIILRDNKKYGSENHFYRGGSKSSDKAQNILEKAIQKGSVERKYICEKCADSSVFKDGRTAIQAHHCDYNKPLDVMWLCQKCHHQWHKENEPIQLIEKGDELNVKGGNAREIHPTAIDVVVGGFP